jgi:AcrR family transcriptional regulator
MPQSRGRQQRAQLTRQRICDAAKELFLTRGYTTTTITEIARAAGVAQQTVYFTFGSKAAVLSAVLDAEIVGDVAAVPLLERPQVARIARAADPLQRLRRVVDVACDVTQRLAPLYEIVRAGAADDEVRALLDRHEDQRWRTLRALAGMLEEDLAAGVGVEEAADRLYALLSHEVLWLLVHRRGWSAARWRDYVTDDAARQLLPAPGWRRAAQPARSMPQGSSMNRRHAPPASRRATSDPRKSSASWCPSGVVAAAVHREQSSATSPFGNAWVASIRIFGSSASSCSRCPRIEGTPEVRAPLRSMTTA